MTHSENAPAVGGAKPWNSRFARLHPRAYLSIHGLIGFLAAAAIVWLLVALANIAPEKAFVPQTDDAVTNWMTNIGTDATDRLFAAVSLLGGPILVAIVIVAVVIFAMRRDWLRAGTLVASGLGGVLLNSALHASFGRFHTVDATTLTNAAQSWNFPSGHAINSLVCYGMLAYLIAEQSRSRGTRSALVIGVIILIAIIGLTRVYLGVHSMSDVISGYAAGTVWLLVCIAGFRFERDQRSIRPTGGDSGRPVLATSAQ